MCIRVYKFNKERQSGKLVVEQIEHYFENVPGDERGAWRDGGSMRPNKTQGDCRLVVAAEDLSLLLINSLERSEQPVRCAGSEMKPNHANKQ